MFDFSEVQLEKLVIHRVGNKLREEGLVLASNEYELTDGNVEELLLTYFLSAFKDKAVYAFFDETDLHLNEVYMYASQVFIHRQRFYEQSVNAAKYLYENSVHPQVKGGEFYMAFFSGCLFDGQKVDAIGIFKTERKENYLKVSQRHNNFMLDADKGISVRKLDKGCIIFNVESVSGYRVAVVDNLQKGTNEAVYWKEDFLRLRDVQDAYFHTQNHLALCKDFAENVYAPIYNASKKDQVIFIKEAIDYFDKNSEFNLDDFAQQVIKEPVLIDQFKEHKALLETNQGLQPIESFEISNPAVKKVKRKNSSLIKLDTGIEINVKKPDENAGQTQVIERGFDETKGMHFYKVYFNEEA